MDEKPSVSLEQILARLRYLMPILRENYAVQSLEVFGSYVRGEANAASDLDLLVTFSETPSLFQYIALENYLSDYLAVEVDLVIKDALKPVIAQKVLKEAQRI